VSFHLSVNMVLVCFFFLSMWFQTRCWRFWMFLYI